MSEEDVEEVEKPLILVVGFFFHNDSILWGLVKPRDLFTLKLRYENELMS